MGTASSGYGTGPVEVKATRSPLAGLPPIWRLTSSRGECTRYHFGTGQRDNWSADDRTQSISAEPKGSPRRRPNTSARETDRATAAVWAAVAQVHATLAVAAAHNPDYEQSPVTGPGSGMLDDDGKDWIKKTQKTNKIA